MNTNEFYQQFSAEELEILSVHLKNKASTNFKEGDNKLNVVVDLLHECEINCIGCGIGAFCIRKKGVVDENAYKSVDQLEIICQKISEYAKKYNRKVFVNLGGGEPFLRKDIVDVVKLFYRYFGKEGVGIDTNGALDYSYELIHEVSDYLSYVGISLNGLKDYHNWWSGAEDYNPYDRTLGTIRKLCEDEKCCDILEVTSVSTKKNIDELPQLMEILSDIGVKKYSIHRAIPVGRMSFHGDLIPDATDYLKLLINLIKVSKRTNISFHMHHSIENIHSALLLNDNTYTCKEGDPNSASSIGISPEGEVVFNAWCMVGDWKKLSCGNIYDDNVPLEQMFNSHNSNFRKALDASSEKNRCEGCNVFCSGGSRIVAAFSSINRNKNNNVTVSDILDAFDAVDPACPYYI